MSSGFNTAGDLAVSLFLCVDAWAGESAILCIEDMLGLFPVSACQMPAGPSIMKIKTFSRHDYNESLMGRRANEGVRCPREIRKLEPRMYWVELCRFKAGQEGRNSVKM